MCHEYARSGEFEGEWERIRVETSDSVEEPLEESDESERTEPAVPTADD